MWDRQEAQPESTGPAPSTSRKVPLAQRPAQKGAPSTGTELCSAAVEITGSHWRFGGGGGLGSGCQGEAKGSPSVVDKVMAPQEPAQRSEAMETWLRCEAGLATSPKLPPPRLDGSGQQGRCSPWQPGSSPSLDQHGWGTGGGAGSWARAGGWRSLVSPWPVFPWDHARVRL